ncbi:helix-turn-helix domain-containing protein [Streptomyces albidoflavus]|uniref:helix-turn-helix domain-containing protein n=1 Tax=Streptomyces albidoflavus TaxID=1886 RepID=UPI0033F174C2
MKRKHEGRFRQATEAIEAQFTDHTRAATVRYATSLRAFDEMFPEAYKLTDDEKGEGVAMVNAIADGLAGLTVPARSLLAYIVAADNVQGIAEVSRRTRRSQSEIRRIMEELERLGYAHEEREPDEGEPLGALKLLIHTPFDGWPFWDDLRNYFEEDPDRIEHIESVIVDLDFTLLD